MKEVTTILNLQLTYIGKYDDAYISIVEKAKDSWANQEEGKIKRYTDADDVKVISVQDFVIDVEGDQNDEE
jgi:hypothetical protein